MQEPWVKFDESCGPPRDRGEKPEDAIWYCDLDEPLGVEIMY